MDRRSFLLLAAAGTAGLMAGCRHHAPASPLSSADEAFLDDLQRCCFRYFLDQTDLETGLTMDRGNTDGGPYTLDARPTANVTVTGFGLVGFCIAAERGWIPVAEATERVRTALRFLARRAAQEHGWYYHWLHLRTGERAGAFSRDDVLSEISTIDSAFLVGGVLTAARYLQKDREIVQLADEIYRRVDFPWVLQEKKLILCHGWTPERGFIVSLWDEYSEASLLYLLGIGSPTHPIPPESWYAWKRNMNFYGPYRFVGTTPLFTMQYSHAFVDFRGRKETDGSGVDWFENSSIATEAHRQFCIDLGRRFPGYSEDIWGITASRSVAGYTSWGGPPLDPRIDGTVVPSAPGGSLMFTPQICIAALQAMRERYGDKIYGRYGFTDAFNPNTGWISPDVTGLGLGITLLAAENLRTGKPWKWSMAVPELSRALDLARVVPAPAAKKDK